MKNIITIEARCFPIVIKDNTSGIEANDSITLSKQQLQAAQIVGQSSKELIHRLCEREGFTVLDIGKAEKRSILLDLSMLWWKQENREA